MTAFLEWLTPSSLTALVPYSSTLSVLLNEKGGIIDDTIITKHAEDTYYIVTNAGRRDRDLEWFRTKVVEWNANEKAAKAGPVKLETLEGWGLLALQGQPQLQVAVMNPHTDKIIRSRIGRLSTRTNVIRSQVIDVRQVSIYPA